MKEKIHNNLFLSVDYQDKNNEDGTKTVQFYLIGTLPVLIEFKNGKREVGKLKLPEPIKSDDPELRSLVGKKATEEKRKRYKPAIKNIVERFDIAINQAMESKKWGKKKINNVSIIKLDYGDSKKESGKTDR